MKKILFLLTVIAFAVSCTRVPITKRKQLKLMNEQELIAMADTAYSNFLAKHTVLPKSDERSVRVERVGKAIAKSIEGFLEKEGASNRIEGFNWQFNVVDEETVNAWCMPGGKVVVYTGILPLADDDTLLAVVMGHEIAHAVARHGNERMSQGTAVNIGGVVLQSSTGNKGELFSQSYGVASALGMLKYSRTHETEADKMGLVFMKLAGYNPYKAVVFWEKMAALGGSTPQILSTHPSDETRIADIKKFLEGIDKYTN